MPVLPKICFPIPANSQGKEFSHEQDLLTHLAGENSGQFLVSSQGMWHGGIHITDATTPWCALSGNSAVEQSAIRSPHTGQQAIRCMADGDILAYRLNQADHTLSWRTDNLHFSGSFVLVKHYAQPGETAKSGLTFYTLYMHLAPFAAYWREELHRHRTLSGIQRYYLSPSDVENNVIAGTLPAHTPVTLGDQTMTRRRDRRQFTLVTLGEEVQGPSFAAASPEVASLKAGSLVWTVSDRGNLKTVPPSGSPSCWWGKSSPGYRLPPGAGQLHHTVKSLDYYLSGDDVEAGQRAGTLPGGTAVALEPDNPVAHIIRFSDAVAFSLVTVMADTTPKVKQGDRVWLASEGGNLTPLGGGDDNAGPVFNRDNPTGPIFDRVVVLSKPLAIKAGDAIGHMGFYQLPEEMGLRSRYQVHIECLSMDPNLPLFLTNPEQAGEKDPAYLKYAKDAPLFMKNTQGHMVNTGRFTRAPGLLTLSKVPVVKVDGQPAFYQIRPEGGFLAADNVKTVSQYALQALGFEVMDDKPDSFDLINGKNHPQNIVKRILQRQYAAAKNETRTSHRLTQYYYKRLLDLIDANEPGYYQEREYLRALHYPSSQDALQRIIAKHPSEWYYGKDDRYWKNYLDTLTKDAPLWKAYAQGFIDKLSWMKEVQELGPEPWHMHPVVFLSNFISNQFKITVLMLYQVFSSVKKPAKQPFFQEMADEINKNFQEYKLDSLQRLNHFFAQVRAEMGAMAEPSEGFNYSEEGLVSTFKYFREHSNEANYYSYKKTGKRITTKANEEEIAKRAYANRLGNGSVASGEGLKYKGRGCIHLTGKDNYKKFNNYHKDKWSDNIDFIEEPSKLEGAKYCVRSAVYFWLREKLYFLADAGASAKDVDSITAKVNLYTKSYMERQEHFERITNGNFFKDAFK